MRINNIKNLRSFNSFNDLLYFCADLVQKLIIMSFETIMDPNIKTQLPLARVAKISKLVTDELKLPAETSHLITFATVLNPLNLP